MSRKVSESIKKKIAGKQFFKCKNEPGSNLIAGYDCPLWKSVDVKTRGSFDESGYEIDHIQEHSISKNDKQSNL